MKFRLALAICLSIVLIGIASWNRFGNSITPQKDAVLSIESGGNQDTYSNEELVENVINPVVAAPSNTEEIPEGPLNNTDILTRNMLLDYLELSASGNPVDAGSLEYIAKKYSGEMAGLHTFVKATPLDIKVVSDTDVAAAQYAVALSALYKDYSQRMTLATQGIDPYGNKYEPYTNSVTSIYQNMAASLRIMPVPTSLAKEHLELLNHYLSNAATMKSVVTLETDPITTMAGLTAMRDGEVAEATALKTIDEILQNKWGII